MEEEESGYAWMREYERTWESTTAQTLQGVVTFTGEEEAEEEIILKRKHQQQQQNSTNAPTTKAIRRGIHRSLVIVLDMSRAMTEKDFKPNRLATTYKSLSSFIRAWRDENPVSFLGLLATRNSESAQISSLGLSSAARHIELLHSAITASPPNGDASLQNSLSLSLEILRANAPRHSTREVLIIIGALTTCDPGDIITTINDCKSAGLRISFISLAAELNLCKRIAFETGGISNVCLSEKHLTDLLFNHLHPLPIASNNPIPAQLIRMGFPKYITAGDNNNSNKKAKTLSFCVCHNEIKDCGYDCPQCGARICDLPSTCPICGLSLLSSSHLARSYHHLFPVPQFRDFSNTTTTSQRECAGCSLMLSSSSSSSSIHLNQQCPNCNSVFCEICDSFIHDILHNCPTCQLPSFEFPK